MRKIEVEHDEIIDPRNHAVERQKYRARTVKVGGTLRPTEQRRFRNQVLGFLCAHLSRGPERPGRIKTM